MTQLDKLHRAVRQQSDPKRARALRGYFKTGKGEYGEGDVFYGLTVPKSRTLAKRFRDLDLASLRNLLSSAVHEERLIALLVLVEQFKAGDESARKKIAEFYLRNLRGVNNWDLVDLSAHKILGEYLLDKPKTILRKLARSGDLWERRVAVLATFRFIDDGRFGESLEMARMLLRDEHDLIQKAVGWMLREVGKRDKAAEVKFLKKYYQRMPRTMLRYAIEKFPKSEQRKYLKK